MIWVVLFVGAVGIAACPIAFSGLWTKRWFRISWFILIWVLLSFWWRAFSAA